MSQRNVECTTPWWCSPSGTLLPTRGWRSKLLFSTSRLKNPVSLSKRFFNWSRDPCMIRTNNWVNFPPKIKKKKPDRSCSLFICQLAQILPMEENFLLLFRRDHPLESSVEFMKVISRSVGNLNLIMHICSQICHGVKGWKEITQTNERVKGVEWREWEVLTHSI